MTPTGIIEFHTQASEVMASTPVSINAKHVVYFYSQGDKGGTSICMGNRLNFVVTESYDEVSAAIISAL